ncbi:MAG TPA: glycosyltransferase [Caldithrix sp.]|nr:glycosyltransferase [Calditrichaceae bacterium]HEM48976.1 glycosyltransferase [Caldithrix sp.]HES59592.1 glycosyltransferase [Caldithrix sp.]
MDFIFIGALIILIIILATVLFNSLFGPFLNKKHKMISKPKVSILIPARNEKDNITACLEHLLNQDYKNIEIIILDDESNDGTSKIVRQLQKGNPQVKLIYGKPLPNGWTGKNWACHQLSQTAAGEIFIFTDADTTHNPEAVSNTLSWMQKQNLGMLSTFPQQRSATFAEKLIVPIIDFFVYGMLPLWAVYYCTCPALAAANGQWIAIKKDTYKKIGGHKSIKNDIVEDIKLNRLAKRFGIKTLTTAGTGMVFCRMYRSVKDIWHGFSKNFYGLTGHVPVTFLFIEFILLVSCVLPYVLLFFNYKSVIFLSLIALNLIIRAILAIRFRHPFFISVLLHPFSILFAAVIGFNSFYQYHWGNFHWKDRVIQIKQISSTRSLHAEN